jgi:hypothetical protein
MTSAGTCFAYEAGRQCRQSGVSVKVLLVVIAWCLLFLFEALFALLKAALFLPARLLGYRDGPPVRSR